MALNNRNSIGSVLTGATDSTTLDFTVTAGNLTGAVIRDPLATNALVLNAAGVYVPNFCTQATALDTVTDVFVPVTADVLYITAGGVCRRAPNLELQDSTTTTIANPTSNKLQVNAKLDIAGTNALTISGTGLYVPNFCTAANAVDTATDASVPATADVVYVRTDGSCGRAPLPAVVGGITTATDSTSIDFTVAGNNITGAVIRDPLASNSIVLNAAGVYAPNFCTEFQALPVVAYDNTLAIKLLQVTGGGACQIMDIPAGVNCTPQLTALTTAGIRPIRPRRVMSFLNAASTDGPDNYDIIGARGDITINTPTSCAREVTVINQSLTGADLTLTLNLNGQADTLILRGYANASFTPAFSTGSGSMRQGEAVTLFWTGTTYMAL